MSGRTAGKKLNTCLKPFFTAVSVFVLMVCLFPLASCKDESENGFGRTEQEFINAAHKLDTAAVSVSDARKIFDLHAVFAALDSRAKSGSGVLDGYQSLITATEALAGLCRSGDTKADNFVSRVFCSPEVKLTDAENLSSAYAAYCGFSGAEKEQNPGIVIAGRFLDVKADIFYRLLSGTDGAAAGGILVRLAGSIDASLPGAPAKIGFGFNAVKRLTNKQLMSPLVTKAYKMLELCRETADALRLPPALSGG